MHQVIAFSFVGLLLTSSLLSGATASGIPAVITNFYDNANCTGPQAPAPSGGLLTATVLDFCYRVVSSDPSFALILSARTTHVLGTDSFTISFYVTPDCTGPVTADQTGPLNGCIEMGGGVFQKRIVTEILPGTFAGFAIWNTNVIPGSTPSTCFDDISILSTGGVNSAHFRAGACLQLAPGIDFTSALVIASDGEYADITLYANIDCTGASSPLAGCRHFPSMNMTIFAGELGELPTSSPTTSSPTVPPPPTVSPTTSGSTLNSLSIIGCVLAVFLALCH